MAGVLPIWQRSSISHPALTSKVKVAPRASTGAPVQVQPKERSNKVQEKIKNVGATASLMSDSLTIETLRNFLADENKPKDLQPVDILQVINLMVRKAEDHGITDSQQTLARKFNCSVRTITRSLETLTSSKIDYVTVTRRKGRSSTIALNHENIPAEAPLRLLISEEAVQLVSWYRTQLNSAGRKHLEKRFLTNSKPTAQRIINACNGDLELAKRIVEHALSSPLHKKRSSKSLYSLFGRWRLIVATFEAQHGEIAVTPAPSLAPSIAPSVAPQINPVCDPKPLELAEAAIAPPTPPAAFKYPVSKLSGLQLAEQIGKLLEVAPRSWEVAIGKLALRKHSVGTIGTVFNYVKDVFGTEVVREKRAEGFLASFDMLKDTFEKSQREVAA